MKYPHTAQRQAWIRNWLILNPPYTDCLNAKFHADFHEAFPMYRVSQRMWGSSPVPRAMQDLKAMERDGILERSRVKLGTNGQPGFPSWVWAYQFPEKSRQ